MGLDMYLIRAKKGTQEIREVLRKAIVELENKFFGEYNKLEILEKFETAIEDVSVDEVAYWRKANHIHAWFNASLAHGEIEDRERVPVALNDIKDLRANCAVVVDAFNNDSDGWKKVAEEILPTEAEYFYGSTDYDEYYIQQTRETLDMLDGVIKQWDDDYEYYYYAWC